MWVSYPDDCENLTRTIRHGFGEWREQVMRHEAAALGNKIPRAQSMCAKRENEIMLATWIMPL
jgi:hypothetical protein